MAAWLRGRWMPRGVAVRHRSKGLPRYVIVRVRWRPRPVHTAYSVGSATAVGFVEPDSHSDGARSALGRPPRESGARMSGGGNPTDHDSDVRTVRLSDEGRRFAERSAILTGFAPYDLLATGMADLYLATDRDQVGAAVLDAVDGERNGREPAALRRDRRRRGHCGKPHRQTARPAGLAGTRPGGGHQRARDVGGPPQRGRDFPLGSSEGAQLRVPTQRRRTVSRRPRPRPDGLGFTANGYFVQNGELPYGTDYLRAVGGSGMHWLGICLRMHPDDFAVKTRYGYGRDWPIGYHDLEAYYAAAEREIGVAGDAQEQRELGIPLDPSYVYPMHKIPSSYIDEICRTTASAASATPAACRAALSQPAPCPGQGTTRILRQCHLRNRSPPDRVRPRGRLPEGPHGKPERRRARRPLQRRTILTHRDPRCA